MPIEIEIDGHGVLEFPDGTSEDVIQSTVRRVTGAGGAQAPDDRATRAADRMIRDRGADPAEFRAIAEAFERQPGAETQLSMLGSLLGPMGSGAGAGVGALLEGKSAGGAAKSAAINFAVPAAVDKTVGALRPVASNLLRRGAARAMYGALKPDRGYLQKMSGANKAGIVAMEKRLVDKALDKDVNPVTNAGLDKIQGLVDETHGVREAKVLALPDEQVSGQASAADRAAQKALRKASRGNAAQHDIAVTKRFIDQLHTSPATTEVKQQAVSFVDDASPILGPSGERLGRLRAVPGKEVRGLRDLTPRELMETNTADNARLKGLFAGAGKNAEINARMAVRNANAGTLDRVAGTEALGRELRDLIDLRNVANIASRRAASTNPINLPDVISLSAGRPEVFAASVGMKAPMLAGGALKLNRASKSVLTPNETAEAVRRLMIALGLTSGE